jgi:uncharacterized membrane protein YeaQ/YmgE (transglycosylase-associated protein family)
LSQGTFVAKMIYMGAAMGFLEKCLWFFAGASVLKEIVRPSRPKPAETFGFGHVVTIVLGIIFAIVVMEYLGCH